MDKNNTPIGFSIQGIETEQFAMIEESFVEKSDIELQTEINFSIDDEKRLVRVWFKVNLLSAKQPFVILELATFFNIKPVSFETFFNEDKTILSLPVGFARHLAVITVGTARGILHAKTESTKFNRFYLPTVNLVEMIKDDVVFNMVKK
jgi:hypothetical protein